MFARAEERTVIVIPRRRGNREAESGADLYKAFIVADSIIVEFASCINFLFLKTIEIH